MELNQNQKSKMMENWDEVDKEFLVSKIFICHDKFLDLATRIKEDQASDRYSVLIVSISDSLSEILDGEQLFKDLKNKELFLQKFLELPLSVEDLICLDTVSNLDEYLTEEEWEIACDFRGVL